MTSFDPNKSYGDSALPSGPYLIAMVGCERKQAKSGGDYMRARFKVIAGPKKGAQFFSSVGIDIKKGGVAARLAIYCKAVGVTKPFDVDSDREFGDAFLGKPFKAIVKQTQNGAYTNNDIEKYVLDLTERENDACEAFWQEWCEKHDGSGFDDSDGGDEWSADDYAETTSSSGKGKSRQKDDDIPF